MTNHIHPTADIAASATIGAGTTIWHHSQVREGARICSNCTLGKGVYVDAGVLIGNNVKIQNYVSLFHGVVIEDGVFIGPHVCFTNDLRPRAVNPDMSLKASTDWKLVETVVRCGAALGANSTIVCGVSIGKWAMIGAGSVVSRNVPAYGLALGNPAHVYRFVCPCGFPLEKVDDEYDAIKAQCVSCKLTVSISRKDWEQVS